MCNESIAMKLLMKKNGRDSKRGFVLVEVIVAVFLFSIVMSISIGSIISAFDVNRKTQSLKSMMNNLNQAVDEMTKALAVGKEYTGGGDTITFISQYGDTVTYLWDDESNSIRREIIEAGELTPTGIRLTAKEIEIENLEFDISGTGEGDEIQPKVSIYIRGSAKAGAREQTTFSLQTMVSQRTPDFGDGSQ